MIVLERVAKIYAETADVDEPIDAFTKLREPEWVDSLTLAEFYMAVEEEFGVELPDHKCIDFKTIGDVVAFVEGQLREQGRDFTTRTGRP